MKHRKLRIAWSVAWGLLAVLLCVLWVRSYWWYDQLTFGRPTLVESTCCYGVIHVLTARSTGFELRVFVYECDSTLGGNHYYAWQARDYPSFVCEPSTISDGILLRFPLWLPTSLAFAGGVLPWLRFSYVGACQ